MRTPQNHCECLPRSAAARSRRARRVAFTSLLAALALVIAVAPAQAASWRFAGQSISNGRSQPLETELTTANVGTLAPKWTVTTHGNVSATPTVASGVVYFPDLGGYVYAVRARSGAQIWQQQVAAYNGVPGSRARVSPAIYRKEIILGDNGSKGG